MSIIIDKDSEEFIRLIDALDRRIRELERSSSTPVFNLQRQHNPQGGETFSPSIITSIVSSLSWQDTVKDKDLNSPPGGESEGDRYLLVGGAAAGAWAGKDDSIAQINSSAWGFTAPTEGMAVYVDDENTIYVYTGAAWVTLTSIIEHLIELSNIPAPGADVDWNFANKHLHITFTSPTTEACVILELKGNTTGRDLLHLHQHTGNPTGPTHLNHMEWDNANVNPMCMRNNIGGAGEKLLFTIIKQTEEHIVTFPDKTLTVIDTADAIDAVEAVGVEAPVPGDWLIFSDAGVLKKVLFSGVDEDMLTAIKAYVDGQTHEAALTTEQVQDIAGSLIDTGGTKTGITITYQDADDDMDFVVDHDAAANFEADEHLALPGTIAAVLSDHNDGNHNYIANTDINWNASTVSQAEAEAGVAETDRKWTALRVAQAIAALESGGSPATYTKWIYMSTVLARSDLTVGISVHYLPAFFKLLYINANNNEYYYQGAVFEIPVGYSVEVKEFLAHNNKTQVNFDFDGLLVRLVYWNGSGLVVATIETAADMFAGSGAQEYHADPVDNSHVFAGKDDLISGNEKTLVYLEIRYTVKRVSGSSSDQLILYDHAIKVEFVPL
jgi:hypothetical protein